MSKSREVILLVGTRKGAFVFRSNQDRSEWTLDGPHVAGSPIYCTAFDSRDNSSVYAASSNDWFGPAVYLSRDQGRTWRQAKSSPKFTAKSGATVKKLWHVAVGPSARPGEVWAGAEPAALFRSTDSGDTWRPVNSLNNHATVSQWQPGGGGLCLHTIVQDAGDSNRMYVGVSAGGAYRTDNAGRTWRPINHGVHCDFTPGPPPEVGA